jgi:hypothetical protein
MAIPVFRRFSVRSRRSLPMTRFQRLKKALTSARTLYPEDFCQAVTVGVTAGSRWGVGGALTPAKPPKRHSAYFTKLAAAATSRLVKYPALQRRPKQTRRPLARPALQPQRRLSGAPGVLHECAEDRVHAGLVAVSLLPEKLDHVLVQA